ncbi:MAG: hypothetical protein ACREQZ_15110, partial [Woeseiaceae bacterium]
MSLAGHRLDAGCIGALIQSRAFDARCKRDEFWRIGTRECRCRLRCEPGGARPVGEACVSRSRRVQASETLTESITIFCVQMRGRFERLHTVLT